MAPSAGNRIAEQLQQHETELVAAWLTELQRRSTRANSLLSAAELKEQCTEFVRLLRQAVTTGELAQTDGPHYQAVREMLARLSRSRSIQGFTPSETAAFVFGFKQVLFEALRRGASGQSSEELVELLWQVSAALDQLGLYTTTVHQKTREEVIARQQQEMLELSTPVVTLWDGVLALPLIGTLDSGRTQTVMEALLQRIVETGSEIAIIDITGVPTVDTLTAQHLLKTITATRLMGAECIISGIRPQIAQTIVHLGVDLEGVTTKASLASAFQWALDRTGLTVVKKSKLRELSARGGDRERA